MKPRISRIIAMAFAALMLLSLASCVQPGNSDATSTAAPSAATTAATPESSSPYKEDDLGEMNLNTTIGVLAWSDVEHFEFNEEIGLEKSVSDLVLSKLNSRLGTVQKRLGVTIEFTAIPGNSSNSSSWNSYLEKSNAGRRQDL